MLTFFHPPLRYIYHESARPFPPIFVDDAIVAAIPSAMFSRPLPRLEGETASSFADPGEGQVDKLRAPLRPARRRTTCTMALSCAACRGAFFALSTSAITYATMSAGTASTAMLEALGSDREAADMYPQHQRRCVVLDKRLLQSRPPAALGAHACPSRRTAPPPLPPATRGQRRPQLPCHASAKYMCRPVMSHATPVRQ